MPVVVVESPAKAKTINKYLGPDYTVLASYGHVRDLPPKDGSVDTEHDFSMKWEVAADSKKHVRAIAEALKSDNNLILATDPDREGEAMSVFSTCGMGAAAVAPLLGEFLIDSFSFTAFFVAAMMGTAIASAMTRLLPTWAVTSLFTAAPPPTVTDTSASDDSSRVRASPLSSWSSSSGSAQSKAEFSNSVIAGPRRNRPGD